MSEHTLFRHQSALLCSLHEYPSLSFQFMIGGYGCGKSFTDVALLLAILHWYQGCYLNFGIGGAAIKHLKETVIHDFCLILDINNIPYKSNAQEGIIQVGTITFIYFSLDRPESIFGFNLAGCLLDEGDELTDVNRYKISAIAIQERCRVSLPATRTQPVARSPFMVSTTTAQGMRGVYRFIKYLREKRIPYVKIRGKTTDNTSLDPQQIKNLRMLYTEEEARAYMDGEFINLSVGRVYAEFNEKKHSYMNFPVRPDDHLFVGQDFNAGYNAATVFIMRGSGEAASIYEVDEYHWNVVGDAPRKLREIYPTNPITLIPDVNGKEIMRGWQDEFDKYGINTFWYDTNPSISERILCVNKLWRLNRLKIQQRCKRSTECFNLRGFDDSGKPKKDKGPEALDHWGDSVEYAIWHMIHTIGGFEAILTVLHSSSKEIFHKNDIDNITALAYNKKTA